LKIASSRVKDRRTDGRTAERAIANSALYMLSSRGKNRRAN